MPFTFQKLEIEGLVLATPRVFGDSRGFFFESYKESEFAANGIPDTFCQDNLSKSAYGVLRGLHFQLPPHGQGKLVSVVLGEVWDVVVDLRKGSATFGRWTAVELNDESRSMLFVPAGFAHGFLTLSPYALFSYKCTAEYAKDFEAGIRWNDEDLGIPWPIEDPVVSDKDRLLPDFRHAPSFG